MSECTIELYFVAYWLNNTDFFRNVQWSFMYVVVPAETEEVWRRGSTAETWTRWEDLQGSQRDDRKETRRRIQVVFGTRRRHVWRSERWHKRKPHKTLVLVFLWFCWNDTVSHPCSWSCSWIAPMICHVIFKTTTILTFECPHAASVTGLERYWTKFKTLQTLNFT